MKKLDDAVDALICSVLVWRFIHEQADEGMQRRYLAEEAMRAALSKIHPSNAFCDVLTGSFRGLPEGVGSLSFGPPVRDRFMWS